jgi:hypothetical protein
VSSGALIAQLTAAGWTRVTKATVCGCKGVVTRHCERPAVWVRPGYEQPRCAHHAIEVTEDYPR